MGKSPSSFSLQPSRRVSPVLRIPDLPFRVPQKSFTAPDCKDFSKKHTLFLLFHKNTISLPCELSAQKGDKGFDSLRRKHINIFTDSSLNLFSICLNPLNLSAWRLWRLQ